MDVATSFRARGKHSAYAEASILSHAHDALAMANDLDFRGTSHPPPPPHSLRARRKDNMEEPGSLRLCDVGRHEEVTRRYGKCVLGRIECFGPHRCQVTCAATQTDAWQKLRQFEGMNVAFRQDCGV